MSRVLVLLNIQVQLICFQLYIMFLFVICDWNIRVVVGMGAQGLFILGFSLSVEVTFTFLSESYLVHILLENKIHPIRLLECAKAFPACRGSLTKSLLPFSSTFPLPLARSQIFPSRLSAFVFVRVCVCHWPGLISLMATRLSLCLSICQICQYATFVNMPGLLICHIC